MTDLYLHVIIQIWLLSKKKQFFLFPSEKKFKWSLYEFKKHEDCKIFNKYFLGDDDDDDEEKENGNEAADLDIDSDSENETENMEHWCYMYMYINFMHVCILTNM